MKSKECNKCNIDKQISEYSKDKTRKDGYSYTCKVCKSKNSKKWAKDNKEHLKEKYETLGIRENTWFTFYHDPSMYACKFDSQGQIVKKIDTVGPKKSTTLKERLHIQNLNVQKNNRVTLSCPSCLIVRDVSVDKYAGKKHFLTVNCPCGTTYGINLNFRKHYRKNVSIGGYYADIDSDFDSTDSSNIPSGSINCRIKNISLGGVGFTALSRVRVRVGDELRVRFTLDKEPPEVIEKKVVVRGIRDNYIGCEFNEETGYSDRTLGFYLLK